MRFATVQQYAGRAPARVTYRATYRLLAHRLGTLVTLCARAVREQLEDMQQYHPQFVPPHEQRLLEQLRYDHYAAQQLRAALFAVAEPGDMVFIPQLVEDEDTLSADRIARLAVQVLAAADAGA